MGPERRGRAVHGRLEVNPSGEEPTDRPRQKNAGLWEPYDGRLSRTVLSLNPPTGLWDRRLGPGGRWAGACVRAGAFWGVQDWGVGLVRVGGVWGLAALRRALWAAQMSRGRLRMCPRAVVKVGKLYRWLRQRAA